MKAYELLEKPEAWTREAFARDKKNKKLPPWSAKAVCWCISGAVSHCYLPANLGEAHRADQRLRNRLGGCTFTWNDAPERTHAEVCALLKELDL